MRSIPTTLLVLLALVFACGESTPPAESPAGSSETTAGEPVEERVVYEKQPDGSVKKTTIRTTRRVVPAPAPPARPADPFPSDSLIRYNVDRVNAHRAKKSLPPLLYDAKVSAFALAGSEQLARDHTPHAHFAAKAKGSDALGSRAAENQGDPSGVPAMDTDRVKNGQRQIDVMLDLMIAEGPGGGHYDNIMNPKLRRIGIGLFYAGGKLYMTNDLSD